MQHQPYAVEAVVFFDERGVGKEMLYPEFEALLDGVVALPEYADRELKLAYVTVTRQLAVRRAVFFLLDFDDDGFADRGWNVPLRQLAERTGHGPDLGAGPIRLACRSQCPVAWLRMNLWDPGDDDLLRLRDALRRNNLGLLMDDEVLGVDTSGAAAAEATPQGEGREPASDPIPRAIDLERQLQRLERRAASWQQQLETTREELQRQQALNAQLQQRLAEQAETYRRDREELSEQLRAVERQNQAELDALRTRDEAELQVRIDAAVAGYREQLAVREVELDYRNELDAQMQQDIERLEQERERLAAQSAERLAAHGMMFVVYHPGVGHLTVSLQDLPRYLDNPEAYAATRCFVGEAHYRQWLEHYRQPCCSGDDGRCGAPLARIEVPREFVPGRSDRCERHLADDDRLLTTG